MLCVTRWWFQHHHNSDKEASITWYFWQVPTYASSLLTRQGPWMTFCSATTCCTHHKRNMTQQSTHTMNKGPWTLFLCTHSITCEYVQLDWLHNTFYKRHKSLCLLTSNSRKKNHHGWTIDAQYNKHDTLTKWWTTLLQLYHNLA